MHTGNQNYFFFVAVFCNRSEQNDQGDQGGLLGRGCQNAGRSAAVFAPHPTRRASESHASRSGHVRVILFEGAKDIKLEGEHGKIKQRTTVRNVSLAYCSFTSPLGGCEDADGMLVNKLTFLGSGINRTLLLLIM